jgi:hypothetical protein
MDNWLLCLMEAEMKLCIRAHDLGVKGTEAILSRLEALGLDGVQMVCYKAYDDIAYLPGGITREKARAIGKAFAESGRMIITDLPALAPDPLATILKVEFADIPRRMVETDLAAWLGNLK